jgi:hypothetical protein
MPAIYTENMKGWIVDLLNTLTGGKFLEMILKIRKINEEMLD